MSRQALARRLDLASRLTDVRRHAAEAATLAFLDRHPEWVARYGAAGLRQGVDDGIYHLEHLAGAVAAGSPEAFAAYLRWSAAVLVARGLVPDATTEFAADLALAVGNELDAGQSSALAPYFEAGRAAAAEAATGAGIEHCDLADEHHTMADTLIVGSRSDAMRLARQARSQAADLVEFYTDFVTPVLCEIGRRWQAAEITVAQEHVATAIAQAIVTVLYVDEAPTSGRRGSVVVTGLHDEIHQIAGYMVANALETDGWGVRFLGTNLPQRDILAMVAEVEPDVVCLSVTLLSSLPRAARLLQALRDLHGDRVYTLVGGRAFEHGRALALEAGADAVAASLPEGLELLRAGT